MSFKIKWPDETGVDTPPDNNPLLKIATTKKNDFSKHHGLHSPHETLTHGSKRHSWAKIGVRNFVNVILLYTGEPHFLILCGGFSYK